MFVRCLHSNPLQWRSYTEIFYLQFSSKSQRNYKITSWSCAICLQHERCMQPEATVPLSEWFIRRRNKNVAVEFPLQTAEGNEKYSRYDSPVIAEIFHSLQRNWKIFSEKILQQFSIRPLSPRKFSFHFCLSCVRIWRMAKFSIPDSFYK